MRITACMLAWSLALTLIGGVAERAVAGPLAREARVVAIDGATTVVLRFDAPVTPEVFTLAEPYRVVVDFPDARLTLGPTAPAGVAAGLRHGRAGPDRARLVIDLAAPAAASASHAEGVVTVTLTPTDAAAFRAAAGWPPGLGPVLGRPPRDRRPTVVLDPGHGGADPGAVRGGLVEKDITLSFSRALAHALRTAGFAVAKTRDADVFVSLAERVDRARAAGADLFLSIHADALPRDEASGVSVYTLSAAASDAEAAALASRENRADAAVDGAFADEDPDIAAALIDLVRRDTLAEAERMARAILAAFPRGDLLAGRPHRAAGFRVLKAPDIPSALIEIGFLSSARDRARIEDPAWRARAVAAITQAVTDWFAERRVASTE